MSAAPLRFAAMTNHVHPWRLLRRLGHATLMWHDGGHPGVTKFETATISIRRGQSQATRRSVCMHELEHLERGPVPMGMAAKEEEKVRRVVARKMLPDIRQVGEALAWARDLGEAADELWVDELVLRDRLRTLHPAERGYLAQRLSDIDGTVPHVGHNGDQEDSHGLG